MNEILKDDGKTVTDSLELFGTEFLIRTKSAIDEVRI